MGEGFRHLRLAGTAATAAVVLTLVLPTGVQADQVRPVTASAGGSVSGSADGSAARGPFSGPFVALGDSFAAGNLIPSSPTGTPAGACGPAMTTAPTPRRRSG